MLTKKQKQILDFIIKYIKNNGYSPSLEEIGKHFKLSSVATVHQHVKTLKQKGYLNKSENQARSIEISKNKKLSDLVKIPILGTIAAGEPIEAIEEKEIISVQQKLLLRSGEHFALRVKGDSMIDEGIFNGSIVIIRKQPTVENGETAVALINGNEVTLKKIYREKDRFRLQPANPTMKPIFTKELEIQGKVISVIREFDELKEELVEEKKNIKLDYRHNNTPANHRNYIHKTNFEFVENDISTVILNKLKSDKILDDYFWDKDFLLINGDCIKVMKSLIDCGVKFDHIITDIPYGIVNGLSIEGWKAKGNIPDWDSPLDIGDMLQNCFNISRTNANLLLFAQEPMTNELINEANYYQKYGLSNKMMWVKNNHANGFSAKTTPVNYYEEILLFRKKLDETNSIEIRKYFKDILSYIGKTKKEILEETNQGLDHCFRYANRTFYIPTFKNYDILIKKYGINKLPNFISYEQLKIAWDKENKVVFNIPENQNIVKNIFEVKKDTNNIHPTQKPLKLLEQLIVLFSNKDDSILDFTAGSCSTGIAAIKLDRKFIGIELNKHFYNEAIKWYKTM